MPHETRSLSPRVRANAAVVLLLALCIAVVASVKPTKTYERAMLVAVEAEEELLLCRAQNSTERLKDAACFALANAKHPYNATWWKQLGALRLMSSQLLDAAACFDSSATTILEANGFIGPLAKTQGLSHLGMLRLYRRRELDGAYELAKAWYTSHVIHHRLMQARTLLTDFMDELYPDDRTPLYRDLGALGDVAEIRALGKKGTKRCRVCLMAEEIPFALERWSTRMLSGRALADEGSREEARTFMTKYCGSALPYANSYQVSDLLRFVSQCAIKGGDVKELIKKDGEAALKVGYLALDRTVLHLLASFGMDYLIRHIVTTFPATLEVQDNFGRTPLHYAAAHNRASSFALLASLGADARARDAGGVTPTALACSGMRVEFEKVAPPNACAGQNPVTERMVEDEDDDVDTSGGGYRDAKSRAEAACPYDLRSSTGLSHDTLVAEFLLSSRPIVLRSLPRKYQNLLRRDRLASEFGDVWTRVEQVPRGEHFGHRVISSNTSISSVLAGGDGGEMNATFASVEAPNKHALHRSVRFMPEVVVPKGKGVGYTTAKDGTPMLVLAGPGAASNHAMADSHVLHVVAHGRVSFHLRPPAGAIVTSYPAQGNVTSTDEARCVLQGGDMIVIPSLWSRALRSHSESASYERRFYWR